MIIWPAVIVHHQLKLTRRVKVALGHLGEFEVMCENALGCETEATRGEMIGGKKQVKDLTRLFLSDCQTAQLVHLFGDFCLGSHPPLLKLIFQQGDLHQ
jgi:hypothetical protein